MSLTGRCRCSSRDAQWRAPHTFFAIDHRFDEHEEHIGHEDDGQSSASSRADDRGEDSEGTTARCGPPRMCSLEVCVRSLVGRRKRVRDSDARSSSFFVSVCARPEVLSAHVVVCRRIDGAAHSGTRVAVLSLSAWCSPCVLTAATQPTTRGVL